MKKRERGSKILFIIGLFIAFELPALDVQITEDLESVTWTENGKTYRILRNQDPENMIIGEYAKTSRKCPPFCITPMNLAAGVETIGELEVLNYLRQKIKTDHKDILLIDSRVPKWLAHGTIPGAINIPWTQLSLDYGTDPLTISDILVGQFSVIDRDGLWDFSNAKQLIFFCNGIWCSQSPRNIHTLLKLGYPAAKIKWYRGGMQSWKMLGFSVELPAAEK